MPFCCCHRSVEKVLTPVGARSLCNTQGCSAEKSACFRKGHTLQLRNCPLKILLEHHRSTGSVTPWRQTLPSTFSLSFPPAAPCAGPSMSQNKHWICCMRKIRGIIPVTNSLSICQFNVKLGQLPVGLGQEQDEATGAGRAAWLSYSELKCSWCYSLSLKSRMTQQNTLNWFLDLCIVVLCTHYPKYPRKKAANSELAYTFPAGLGRLVVVRGIPCQHEFI